MITREEFEFLKRRVEALEKNNAELRESLGGLDASHASALQRIAELETHKGTHGK